MYEKSDAENQVNMTRCSSTGIYLSKITLLKVLCGKMSCYDAKFICQAKRFGPFL
jgi:hypothetical protein